MGEERKRIWIDSFQTRLSLRIAGYLLVFLIVFVNFLFAWKMCEEGPLDPAHQFFEVIRANLPAFVCLLILAPVAAWDSIHFTHRIVGPLVRFRQAMQAIAEGEAVRPIKLREGDHLTELRDDFNAMLEALQKQGVNVLKPIDPPAKPDAKKTA
jgi:methyl-accepting chemotaxis protein